MHQKRTGGDWNWKGKDDAAIVVIVLKLLCLVRRQHKTWWCIGFRQSTLPTAYWLEGKRVSIKTKRLQTASLNIPHERR